MNKESRAPRGGGGGGGDSSFRNRMKDKNLQTKVVIRRLPPTMTEADFLEQISPIPPTDYSYFVKADLSLGIHSFSRAYLNFCHQEDIFVFKDQFDGYVFVDGAGNEFPALVEFSPFQKTPKKRSKKRDAKCGTLETDPDWLKFMEGVENPPEESNLPSAETYLEEMSQGGGAKQSSTPLIEFLKQRKLDRQRVREEKRDERKRREMDRKKHREEDSRRKRNNNQTEQHPGNKEQGEQGAFKPILLKNTDRDHPHKGGNPRSKEYPSHSSNSRVGGAISGSGYNNRGNNNQSRRERERDKYRNKPKREERRTFNNKNKSQTMPTQSQQEPEQPLEEQQQPHDEELEQKSLSPQPTEATALIEEDPAVVAAAIEKQHVLPSGSGNKHSSSDNSGNGNETQHRKTDTRKERRIRNKDRPTMEIYRPGMRRMSSTQLLQKDEENASAHTSGGSSLAPSPTEIDQ